MRTRGEPQKNQFLGIQCHRLRNAKLQVPLDDIAQCQIWRPEKLQTVPKHFTGVEYIIIRRLDPIWGLFGTRGGFKRTNYPPKKPWLGEKHPSTSRYPGHAQIITEHPIWMDNTYILYPDPFSITWVTEKALSHIHSNAAIAKSSDKRPWQPRVTKMELASGAIL